MKNDKIKVEKKIFDSLLKNILQVPPPLKKKKPIKKRKNR